MKRRRSEPVRLFVSYSHLDKVWFDRLGPLLKIVSKTPSVGLWHDQELTAATKWKREIENELEKMDIFVCLVSHSFLASDFILGTELKRALARQKKGEVEILPILPYPINLEIWCPDLHSFQRLPPGDRCWQDYAQNGGHYQYAHESIAQGLRQAIEKMQSKLGDLVL